MVQIITPQEAKLGPNNNSTLYNVISPIEFLQSQSLSLVFLVVVEVVMRQPACTRIEKEGFNMKWYIIPSACRHAPSMVLILWKIIHGVGVVGVDGLRLRVKFPSFCFCHVFCHAYICLVFFWLIFHSFHVFVSFSFFCGSTCPPVRCFIGFSCLGSGTVQSFSVHFLTAVVNCALFFGRGEMSKKLQKGNYRSHPLPVCTNPVRSFPSARI